VKHFEYRHPLLKDPWTVPAETLDEAKAKFEDCWIQRVQTGALEHLDNDASSFDGDVHEVPGPVSDTLCPNDLTGHWWEEDGRKERMDPFVTNLPPLNVRPSESFCSRIPVICILCQKPGWVRMSIGGKHGACDKDSS
jgi:hypothetical protein